MPRSLFLAAVLALVVPLALCATALAELKVGDDAPDFTLKDQSGKDVKLSSYKGAKHVLLAFYAKDAAASPLMKSFVKELRKLEARDVMVLGIGVDPVESHATLAKVLGVQFPILADTELVAAKLYDVVVASADGSFASRSAFIVDKEGKVRWFDRNLKMPPATLEGTELLAQIEKIAGKSDPVASLGELPQAERDGKTVFVRFAQALIAEDVNALDAVVHPEACGRPGETPQMQRERRKVILDRWRTLFDKHDYRSLKFNDAIDLRGSRVFAKDAAVPAALAGFSSDARDMATRLAAGELLVIGRTNAPKSGDVTLIPREVVMRIRDRDGAWKIVEILP